MNSTSVDRLVVVAGVLLTVWLAMRATKGGAVMLPPASNVPTNNPIVNDFMRQYPGGSPIQILGTPTNINIGNQGLNYLSNKYIPLFGFVGMAQGVTWQ